MAKKKLDKDMIKSVAGGVDLTGLNVLKHKLNFNPTEFGERVDDARFSWYNNEAEAKFGKDNYFGMFNKDTKEVYFVSLKQAPELIARFSKG